MKNVFKVIYSIIKIILAIIIAGVAIVFPISIPFLLIAAILFLLIKIANK